MRGMLAEILSSDADITVVDMEAGLEHMSRSGGTLQHADHLLAVVEPYAKAIETARRTVALARELGIGRISAVANKVRDDQERSLLQRFIAEDGVELLAEIPYDERIRLADRDGLPAIDAAPNSDFVSAIEAMADRLQAEWPGLRTS